MGHEMCDGVGDQKPQHPNLKIFRGTTWHRRPFIDADGMLWVIQESDMMWRGRTVTLRRGRLKTNDVADTQCSGEVDASVEEEKDEVMAAEDVTCEALYRQCPCVTGAYCGGQSVLSG